MLADHLFCPPESSGLLTICIAFCRSGFHDCLSNLTVLYDNCTCLIYNSSALPPGLLFHDLISISKGTQCLNGISYYIIPGTATTELVKDAYATLRSSFLVALDTGLHCGPFYRI